jgi:hypothetical protein
MDTAMMEQDRQARNAGEPAGPEILRQLSRRDGHIDTERGAFRVGKR